MLINTVKKKLGYGSYQCVIWCSKNTWPFTSNFLLQLRINQSSQFLHLGLQDNIIRSTEILYFALIVEELS